MIGGWAAYLRLQAQKSHDIDLIVDMATMSKLQGLYQLEARKHLAGRKYKTVIRGVGVDVYAAHQSELGERLRLPVEALQRHAETVADHRTLRPEALFVTKLAALLDRPDTLPGEKDRQDIWAILRYDPARWRSDVVAEIFRQARLDPESRRPLIEEGLGYLAETDGLSRSDKHLLKRVGGELARDLARSRTGRTGFESERERD